MVSYECTPERKPSFKLSEPVIVEYNNENMQIKVEKVLGHIVWLLRRSLWTIHKSVKQSREIKKHRSSGNLTENQIQ